MAQTGTLGVFGFLGVGAGFFFGGTHYLSDNQNRTAGLASAIGGSVLLLVADILYGSDVGRLHRAYRRLGTF